VTVPAQRAVEPAQRPVTGHATAEARSWVSGVRAWMVVPAVDAVLLALPAMWNPENLRALIATSLVAVLFLTGGTRYRARLHLSLLDELPSLVTKVLAAAGLVTVLMVLKGDTLELRGYLKDIAIALGLFVAGRWGTLTLINWSRKRGTTSHTTVIVGGGSLATELAGLLERHKRYGLKVVGFVDDGTECIAETAMPQLGALSDVDAVVRRTRADVLLIADGDFSERNLLDAVRTPATSRCDLLVVPRLHQFHTQTGLADHVGSIPVMRIRTPNLNGPARLVKRAFDVVVAGVALLLVSPIMAVCALLVRLEGGPGVIFRQARVGRDGKHFDCLKLRSMRPADEKDSQTTWNIANDKRVGPVGKVLRRTSLDELPQLWNILRGDMTLVGPRPERPHFVDQFSAEFDRYAHRHRVQSGLTGFAQVSGLRGNTSIADRARFDNYYIEHWSLWLDLKIIARTFTEVLFARGR
jgi:exopolysaccharide biosynthesis polyprenyl glycosylphosphotransferase